MIKQTSSHFYVVLDGDGALCGHLHSDPSDAAHCPSDGGQVLRVVAALPREPSASELRVAGVLPRDPQRTGREPRDPQPVSANASVHPTAVVGENTAIHDDVSIGAYAVVGDNVEIGAGCTLGAHSILRDRTIVGPGTRIDSFAVIGGDPQDLSFDPDTPSGVRIGRDSVIREGVTIHRSSTPNSCTVIGDFALLMAHSHVAHDCRVGDSVILANNVMLAGHVHVDCHAFLAGGAGVHQFCRVGEGVMVGGNATISYDVPPFTLVAERNSVYGLNLRGLRRREFSSEEIADLKDCYRATLLTAGDAKRNAAAAADSGRCGHTAPGQRFLEFFATSQRGFVQARMARVIASGSRGR